ncbi:MAG: hypothetical protein JNM51_12470, partial [Bacteroidia bacterium]|nr:hypothetical protein [Bacteroidia bacterium]
MKNPSTTYSFFLLSGYKYLMVIVLFLCMGFNAFSQTSGKIKKSKLKQKSSSIESGLKNGDNDLIIASKYEDLAKELVKNNELVKA